MILDTGSHLLWVRASNCTGCPLLKRKFDLKKSNSTTVYKRRNKISYVMGEVAGFEANEVVSFQGINANLDLLLVDSERDL